MWNCFVYETESCFFYIVHVTKEFEIRTDIREEWKKCRKQFRMKLKVQILNFALLKLFVNLNNFFNKITFLNINPQVLSCTPPSLLFSLSSFFLKNFQLISTIIHGYYLRSLEHDKKVLFSWKNVNIVMKKK